MRDFTLFIPEYIALGSAAGVLALELAVPRLRKDALAWATAAGALAWLIAAIPFIGDSPADFEGLLRTDAFTAYFRVLAAGVTLATALFSARYLRDRTRAAGEYYGLLLTAGAGMSLLAASRELLTAYVSLELLSFSLYVLVGYLKRDARSNEASLKYILLGAFSSAMLLYGISLLYGLTGSTTYAGVAEGLAARGEGTDLAALAAIMLIVAGVGFKVSAAPFHMWAPDAYQGAPLPVTAFLSTASKAAGFALILRLFTEALAVDAAEWRGAIAALAAITMTAGNLIAIQQTNLKRLVAYSSIGQAGYMLVAVAAIGHGDAATAEQASSALLLHIAGYTVSTLALFAALIAHYNRTGDESIDGLRGLSATQPFLALVISASLFSFAGLPFFAGFATKLLLFQSSAGDGLLWLAGLGAANSFVSLYYYLMVMRRMYLFDPPEGHVRARPPALLGAMAGLLLLAVLFIGVYPGPVFEAADGAAAALFEASAASFARLP